MLLGTFVKDINDHLKLLQSLRRSVSQSCILPHKEETNQQTQRHRGIGAGCRLRTAPSAAAAVCCVAVKNATAPKNPPIQICAERIASSALISIWHAMLSHRVWQSRHPILRALHDDFSYAGSLLHPKNEVRNPVQQQRVRTARPFAMHGGGNEGADELEA